MSTRTVDEGPSAGVTLPLNGWLDAFASPHPPFAGADAPAYLVMGMSGGLVGLAALLGLGLWRGEPLAFLSAYAAVALATFVLTAKARRLLFGRDHHVLLEDLLLVFAATGAVAWLLGRPVLPALDLMAPVLGVFLIFGRLGCLSAGCCHGRPARWGIAYDLCAVGPVLAGLRLFPVQLVEAAWTAVVSLLALLFASHAPGTSLAFWLLAYAAGRFGLEFLRGDLTRRHLGALSEAQWIAIGLLAAFIVAEQVRGGWDPWQAGAAGGVGMIVSLGWLLRSWWHSPPASPLTERDVPAWEAFYEQIEAAASARPCRVNGSSPRPGVRVSLEIDPAGGGASLHALAVTGTGAPLARVDAFAIAGIFVQRLPRHEVLLARHDASGLSLTVLVEDEPARLTSGPTIHPRHVAYRARAFARHLELLSRRPPPPEPILATPQRATRQREGTWG